MMSEPTRPTKKTKYAPPQAPRAPVGSSSLRAGHSRSQSVPKATPAALPASKYRGSSAYPTPSTVRKPEQEASARVKSMPPAIDFDAAVAPAPDLKGIGNPDSNDLSKNEAKKASNSDSDGDEGNGSDVSDAYKGEDDDDEDDEEDEGAGKGVVLELAREVVELDSSPREKKGKFRNMREMEEYFESMRRDAVFEESDAEDPPIASKSSSSKFAAPKSAKPKSTASKSAASKSAASKSTSSKHIAPKSNAPKTTAPKLSLPSPRPKLPRQNPPPASPEHPGPSSNPPVKVKVKENVKMEEGGAAVDDYNRVIMRSHVLKSMTSLCGFKKAQEAANVVPLYEENSEPKWFKQDGESKVLVPHFDLPFQENMDGWGEAFDGVVTDKSRMPTKDHTHLQKVSAGIFRSVLLAGAFATTSGKPR
ncbi:hypothetical protein FS749_011889 [Ceratobasidium sp. UAMH 11750]|nr:hypothetical protein FS749_011889 [Ceratobasidium sp. UAMH 11750]